MKVLKSIWKKGIKPLFSFIFLGIIRFYQIFLSPFLGTNCRFTPSCSQYGREAILRYGPFKGGWMALERIARCHPWGGHGHDPVP